MSGYGNYRRCRKCDAEIDPLQACCDSQDEVEAAKETVPKKKTFEQELPEALNLAEGILREFGSSDLATVQPGLLLSRVLVVLNERHERIQRVIRDATSSAKSEGKCS
jgi:hypothetical protein